MIATTPAAVRELTEVFAVSLAGWREARGEALDARTCVVCSILNRCARPAWWGSSPAEVVFKALQYSSLTYPADPQLVRWPAWDDPRWFDAVDLARRGLAGALVHPLPGADSYHDISVATPPRMATGRYCGQLGRLKFFDVDHDYEAHALAAAGPGPGLSPAFIDSLRDFLAPRPKETP